MSITNNETEYSEIEQYILDSGKCFGDWGIVYNQTRNSSAVAAEETHCLTLSKDMFEEYFGKFIIKAENERKKFFKEKLDIFKNNSKFDDYYKRVKLLVSIFLIF